MRKNEVMRGVKVRASLLGSFFVKDEGTSKARAN